MLESGGGDREDPHAEYPNLSYVRHIESLLYEHKSINV